MFWEIYREDYSAKTLKDLMFNKLLEFYKKKQRRELHQLILLNGIGFQEILQNHIKWLKFSKGCNSG
jgi:hypothetical protein